MTSAPDKLLLAAPRGYCAGVDRAVQTVERALELYGPPVYVRKEIVHNKHVVEQLRARGAVFVEELDESIPEGAVTVFSAHGVSPAVHADAHARQLKALVLADFVANRNLRLRRDLGSDARLWARFAAAAKRAGVGSIVSSATQGTVEDDHTPFMDRGVPAIDLIDFDFPQWHTLEDRPNVLSRRSLDAAGEAVVELMRELRRQ